MLVLSSIVLRFGGLVALNDVSFTVDPGELVALVGPNGAGKTAMINCINGVYRPTSGSVLFDGRDIGTLPTHKMAEIGIGRAFQHVELFPHMTVIENILLGRHLHMKIGVLAGGFYWGKARREEAEERARAERLIDFFELYGHRDTPAGSLPYGVQKLVGVARAMALEPKLLLLDEPSTGLVREEKENFARYLLRLRHDLGITILWVEHDMQMVADLADRVVVLSYGIKIADGQPEEVRQDPSVVAAYLGSAA